MSDDSWWSDDAEDSRDEELDELLANVEWGSGQRAAAERNPELAKAWLRYALSQEGLRSPSAFAWKSFKSGEPPRAKTAAGAAPDREKALARYRQWLSNAGLYVDRESELLDELFGEPGSPSGMLRHWAGDDLLRAQVVREWREARARGGRAEQSSEQWQARLREQRERLEKAERERRRKLLEVVGT